MLTIKTSVWDFCQKCLRNGAKSLTVVSQLSVLYSTENSDTLSEKLMEFIALSVCHVTPYTNSLMTILNIWARE